MWLRSMPGRPSEPQKQSPWWRTCSSASRSFRHVLCTHVCLHVCRELVLCVPACLRVYVAIGSLMRNGHGSAVPSSGLSSTA